MSDQPEWELVANLGDVNIADYGGFLVFRDKTGVYQPEAEVYEPNEEDEQEGKGGTMYRFVLEPPRFKTRCGNWNRHELYLNNPRMRGVSWRWYNEWWVKDLPDVARSCGQQSCLYLLRDLLSKDPKRMGMAYRDLTGYFGYFEFDHYPVELTEQEARERYKDVGKR